MNPTQAAEILMDAMMRNDEPLINRILLYTQHMVEIAPEVRTKTGLFKHALRCNQCFHFNMTTGAWLKVEKLWQASEEAEGDQYPWHNDWIMIRN